MHSRKYNSEARKHKGEGIRPCIVSLTKLPCHFIPYYTTGQLLLSVWMVPTPPPPPRLLVVIVRIINWPPLCCPAAVSVATRARSQCLISRTICKCNRLLYNKKISPIPLLHASRLQAEDEEGTDMYNIIHNAQRVPREEQ